MKLLDKYHKQGYSKELLKSLERVNSDLKLKLNLKDNYDLLKLSVYETGLNNKQFFENSFNEIRLQNIDLWDNLTFTERNFILKCDLASAKVKRLSFKHEETPITVPFFDVLMNGLYDKETAILELPQFLKLYKDFHSRMIDIEMYGLKPYRANMAFARHIASVADKTVLYDDLSARFFVLENKTVQTYPIMHKVHSDEAIREAGKALLVDETVFVDALIHHEMIVPKCIQKIEKYRTKGKAL